MICVVIQGPTYLEAHQQISRALVYADLVELRLDCFLSLDLNALKILRSHFCVPMIFTLRSLLHGGNYTQSEEKRLNEIRELLTLKPEYLDLESCVPSSTISEISSEWPKTKMILSYHNFKETPVDLENIYQRMQKESAFFYKIAVTAKNCLDALRFVIWAKKSDNRLIAVSMGVYGQVSRILGPMMGCPLTYASLEEDSNSPLGQLSAKTLIHQYRHHSLNAETSLYGLIGDPTDQSISDQTHNSLIQTAGLNALYVKIQVKSSELPDFLQIAKQLPFKGLSVTMPLKEKICSFLDEIDPEAIEIGAVNTLLFDESKIRGFNTDGVGALNAIEENYSVRDKYIVIIGGGGAAKAIAYEAKKRGGFVTIVNRDAEKAQQIAQDLGCIGKGLAFMQDCAKEGYDILINCTPVSSPILSQYIISQSIVMDITTKPRETAFLKMAEKKGCRVIYGYQMFTKQALGQFCLWFKNSFDVQRSTPAFESVVLDCD